MAISFRFRFFIKSQPEILIKSEETLPENNNVLELLQQENCTSTFPLFDIHSVDQICTLFKPYFLNVVTTIISPILNNIIFTYRDKFDKQK